MLREDFFGKSCNAGRLLRNTFQDTFHLPGKFKVKLYYHIITRDQLLFYIYALLVKYK